MARAVPEQQCAIAMRSGTTASGCQSTQWRPTMCVVWWIRCAGIYETEDEIINLRILNTRGVESCDYDNNSRNKLNRESSRLGWNEIEYMGVALRRHLRIRSRENVKLILPCSRWTKDNRNEREDIKCFTRANVIRFEKSGCTVLVQRMNQGRAAIETKFLVFS